MNEKEIKNWVMNNCKFAQTEVPPLGSQGPAPTPPQPPQPVAVPAQNDAYQRSEKLYLDSFENLQVLKHQEGDREQNYGDNPNAWEPGTEALGSYNFSDFVTLGGQIYFDDLVKQNNQMEIEEDIRFSLSENPPPALAELIEHGDEVQIGKPMIQPLGNNWYNISVDVSISGDREIEDDYEPDDDYGYDDDFRGP